MASRAQRATRRLSRALPWSREIWSFKLDSLSEISDLGSRGEQPVRDRYRDSRILSCRETRNPRLILLFYICFDFSFLQARACGKIASMDLPAFLRFRPVPLRARHDGWTAELQFRFILLLGRGHGPSEAARQLGKSRQTAYDLRKKPGATSFTAAWDAAQAFAREARFAASALPPGQYGLETVLVPRFYRGRLVGFVQREVHRGALRLLARLDRIAERIESGVAASDFEGLLDLIDPTRAKPGKADAMAVRTRPARQFPNSSNGAKGPYSVPATAVTERILGQGKEQGESDAIAS